ncbi:MAG: sel1 repeat family protein [Flavobacteriaceae bacterium]|nr:sel1 repeat family protein [Flavobacteriaceae bacterium]
MKKLLFLIALLTLFPNLASARRVGGLFGKSERIQKIADVDIKGANGEDLYLAHKTTSLFIFMGVYMTDDGYVLGVKGSMDMYYPLNGEQTKNFQTSGALPVPLPPYKIEFTEWLWGFSLWILLAVLTAIWFFPKNKEALFAQGCKYYFGKNTPVNYPKAMRYFEKSAKKEYGPAVFNLGIMNLSGQGMDKDVDSGIELLKRASKLGYMDANVTLGNLYFNGEEVNKDLNKALTWYNIACGQGHANACKMVTHIQQAN